ncbi:MAG: 30S ribosomal protein S12 methylthiotransferase RimO [bacterium]
MPFSFNLISLGCPKNQVDSEEMFTGLKNAGIKFSADIDNCDVCVINTCGFIEAARKESISVIMEAVRKKQEGTIKYVAVTGCMVNNNLDALKGELPEVDLFLPTFDEDKIAEKLASIAGKKLLNKHLSPIKKFEREHFNLKKTAYLKISEGCDRICSFCTIPHIRGSYKSKPIEEIKCEAAYLAQTGVKELIIISQDTSYYGLDLNIKNGLYKLLKELVLVKGIEWIRLMYLYPSNKLFSPDFISLLKNEEKILKYIDMPVQHISGNILRLMKRGETKKDIISLIQKLKKEIPYAALRTSLIAGFPGETDKDFGELLNFIKDVKFDNLGVFKYSDERDASSYKYNSKVSAKIKNTRYKLLMETQKGLMPEILSKHIGRTYNAVVDETDNKTVKLRTYFQAPDIDGCVYLYLSDLNDKFKNKTHEGFVPVKILRTKNYDLLGTPEGHY